MKKIYTSALAITLVASLTFSGCKKDATTATSETVAFGLGSDNATANLSAFNNGNSNLATFATATGTASVAWTSALANVSKFKFDAKKDGVAFEVAATSIPTLDLFTISNASITAVIPNGTYTGVELHVVLAKTTGTALPLVLKGTYTTKAGTTVPIEFDFNDDAEIIAKTSDLVVDGKSDLIANISLHLNQLIANVTTTDIDQTTRTNNTILITNAINTTVYNKIKTDLLLSGGTVIVPTTKK